MGERKKIVVTGALGHIGSRLIRKLPMAFEGGAEIVLLDNLSTQRYCSLFDLPDGASYRFVQADVVEDQLEGFFDGADAVIHLAAITDAAGSFDRQEQVEQVNFVGTQKVARACMATGSVLMFFSTTSVYGTQSETVDESCPASDLKPQSPYAESKLRAEGYLQSLDGRQGLLFVICRFGTIFGTSTGMRFHTAINKFCWQAVNGLPLTVWRTAMDQKRPYLALSDAVEAVKFILRRDLFDRRIYNVVTVNASVREIVELIGKYVPGVSVQYVDTPIMNQLSYHVLNTRFASLGFDFKGGLEAGIRETVELLHALRQ